MWFLVDSDDDFGLLNFCERLTLVLPEGLVSKLGCSVVRPGTYLDFVLVCVLGVMV